MNADAKPPKPDLFLPNQPGRIVRPTCRNCSLALPGGVPHAAPGACIQALQQRVTFLEMNWDAIYKQAKAAKARTESLTTLLWRLLNVHSPADAAWVVAEADLTAVPRTAGLHITKEGDTFRVVAGHMPPPESAPAAPPAGASEEPPTPAP